MATRIPSRTGRPCFLSADVSDLRASFALCSSGCMGANARAGVPQFSSGRQIVMEPIRFAGVDGTGALALPPVIEDEFAKDRWDARHIPGLRYARHTGCYHIDFGGIAEPFCAYVKDYARFLIAADRAVKTIATHIRYLRQFFFFFSQHYPQARSLHDLREPDIDAFILSLQVYLHEHGGKNEGSFVWRHIHTVEA